MTLYFLGGGNMAAALITSLHRVNRAHEVHVVNRGVAKREALAARFGVAVSETLPALTADDVLILAVKPQDMQVACSGVQTNGALVVSLAAGLSLATVSRYLGGTRRIVRAMPNTPAQVGFGVTGLCAADAVSDADKTVVQAIFDVSGCVVWLDDEAQMHAITGVSGSGSAYVFYLLNALQNVAQELGFTESVARELSVQTFKGAVALAEQSGEAFGVLQDKVTSKGGTTFAALEVFRQHQIAEYLGEGVQAAVARSRELAQL